MKRSPISRLWIVGALAGIIVIAGAVRTAATPGHGPVHLVVTSSSGSVAERQVARDAEASPTAAARDVAEPQAVEDEAAENEAAEEANEPAEEANEPAEEANEPAENENENPTPAPTAPTAPPASSTQTFSLTGGTVMVTCTGNAIALDSATPNAGFTIDKEENEDGQVEVRFRSDAHESRLQLTCHNGTVVVEELREENS